MVLLFLESVGTTELLLILVVALMIFGPRKLPELSRSLGKGLGEFKRASDEFKRTWEREVNLDSYERERRIGEAIRPPDEARAAAVDPLEGSMIAAPPAAADSAGDPQVIARGGGVYADAHAQSPADVAADGADASAAPAPQSPHKTDWL
ncbi:MAG: twin-arginine translocase TatA/TatE family subunit [Pyrinomonadaceae bacterium]